MPDKKSVDTRITPSLHPDNVRDLDGFDDETASYLAATETAFSEAYEGIRAVWDARAAAEKNTGWNEEQRIIQLDKLAQKKLAGIARAFDGARSTLVKQIAHFEKELNEPVVNRAAGGIAQEIRAHVKGMDVGARLSFIQKAIADGDEVTIGALLGAPSYLSGIGTKEMQQAFVRQWHERMAPEKAKLLRALGGAKALIEERAGFTFDELQKAVGSTRKQADELGKIQEAALKALEA